MAGRCFGLLSTSIRLSPTPTAPDETIITRCPSLSSLAAVSTISVRIDRIGSRVFSSTMELVPVDQAAVSTRSFCRRVEIDSPSLITIVRAREDFIVEISWGGREEERCSRAARAVSGDMAAVK